MKKLFITIMACLAVTCVMAQGWPANYGGVMLQGFYWDYYDDADWGTWNALKGQANDLEGYIDLIWIPNSATVKSDEWNYAPHNRDMGYMPCYWLKHDTYYGTEAQLKSMISTLKDKGIGIIEDVVINHKNGLTSWCDFPYEKVTVGDKTYELNWSLADICNNDNGGYVRTMFDVTGADDTGTDFDGCRDLDHTGENVQNNVITYLNYLKDELGYAGFRYDMVKGYAPQYVGLYNASVYANTPSDQQFSVGEFWDDYNGVEWWLKGTKQTEDGPIQSAAFDFPLKYNINDAFKGNFNAAPLDYLGLIGVDGYRRYSVTFVDNHDTYRDGSCMSNTSHVLAANAFILAMPGTPCIFLPHWKAYKTQLKKMIAARKAAGINNQSTYERIDIDGGIGFKVFGTDDKSVIITLGYVSYEAPNGYKIVVSGDEVNHDFCFYVKDDVVVPPVQSDNNIRVYLAQTDNIKNYSLHAWNANGNNLTGSWNCAEQKINYLLTDATSKSKYPAGTTCINGKLWYFVEFPHQEVINLVLHNNGSDTNKTLDIENISSDIFLSYEGGSSYDNQTSTYAGYPEAWYEQGEVCAFFTDEKNWENVYAWVWSNSPSYYNYSNDNTNNTGWPGNECSFLGYNEFGQKLYKWTYNGSRASYPEMIIFHNNVDGDKNRTADCSYTNGSWYGTNNIKDGDYQTVPAENPPAPSAEISLASLGTVIPTTNWNGNTENVAENTSGVAKEKDLFLAAGTWIVQAIVRGESGSITLTANGESASVTLTGMAANSESTVLVTGIVDTNNPGENNGWQKVEVTFTLDEAQKVTVKLEPSSAITWQLGDLKVLPGTTVTKASAEPYSDLSKQTDFSFYERSANLNALTKATKGTLPEKLPNNVIVNGICNSLQLIDKGEYNFMNKEIFTANNISYNRTFVQSTSTREPSEPQYNTSTICLPFGLSREEAAAAGSFWALDALETSTEDKELRFIKVDEPVANVPYIFEPITDQPFLTISGKAIPVSSSLTETKDGVSFVGVNTRKHLQSSSTVTYYGYNKGNFVKVGDSKGAYINPFRAYLQIPGSQSLSRIGVLFDGENGGETGIQVVKPAAEPKGEQPIYNLSGQRVKTPNQKGIYIKGGKKYIVK